jgi:hypothetical protein
MEKNIMYQSVNNSLTNTIEMSATYKADLDIFGSHQIDAKAIFKAHGGKWADSGRPTYRVPVEQVSTAKAALEQAGFRVTVGAPMTVDQLLERLDQEGLDDDEVERIEGVLSDILSHACGFYCELDTDLDTRIDTRFTCACVALGLSSYLVDQGGTPPDNWQVRAEVIIRCLTGIAGFTLEAEGIAPDTRQRLERIKNARPVE